MAKKEQEGLGDELFGMRLGELCDASGPSKGEFVPPPDTLGKEEIAGIIAALPKGTVGITDPAWANKRLQQAYPKADTILSRVCKRIEGVENP
jgi:hypothetical protein